jgi:hypothetical protein
MIIKGTAKNPGPPPSVPAGTRSRGRPPKPGGRLSQVEIQRAYRARLAAAGKVVRLVDTAAVSHIPNTPALVATPDFDPTTDGVYEREMFESIRDKLHNASLKSELQEQDIARLEQRNAYLEGELKLQGQHNTNALKELTSLKQQLAQKPAKQQ